MRRHAALFATAALAGCVAAPGVVAPPAPPPAAPVARAPIPSTPFRWTGALSQGGLIRGTAPRGTVSLTLDRTAIPVAADGSFLAGFDRDAGPAADLVATLADGQVVRQSLAIAPREWRIERLNSLPRFPAPDPVMARLRPPELAAIAAARAMTTDAAGWRQRFVWPVTGRQSGWFGSQRIYRGEPGSYHSGADIAKPVGSVVVAPADGVVVLAADHPFTLEGNLLMIDHGMGLNSAFLHLSRIDVKLGEHVRQGQRIALTGQSGRATGPHLHWSLRWSDAKLDPLLVAGPVPQ